MLVSLPTGTGKTVVFAALPGFFGLKHRVLVLAHREELLDQAAEKMALTNPNASVGIEQAGRQAGDVWIVVASVPTLRGERLAALDPAGFSLIVVDEAHHAVTASYRRIFDHFSLFAPDTPRMLVGFTATPRRGDRLSLATVFEEIAFSRGLEEMIGAGFLSRIIGWRVKSPVDLDPVAVRHGDFVESELARTVNVKERNDLLVAVYAAIAAGRKTLAFCADVAHAKAVAAAFCAAGIAAEAVWGDMPRKERAAVLARFKEGATRLVSNCNVLTEGFDEPSVDCILMARPTRSLLLYAQMIGRGTRLFPGKADLMVVDVADNTRKHSLAGLNALFGLPPGLELAGADVLATAERVAEIVEEMPWVDVAAVTGVPALNLVAEQVELFRFDPPEEIAAATRLSWLPAKGGGYQLSGVEGGKVVLRPTLLGWELVRMDRRGKESPPQTLKAEEPAEAVRAADKLVKKRFPDLMRVLQRSAAWREKPPTEKQLQMLRSRKVPTPAGLTRGQAERMLAYLMGR